MWSKLKQLAETLEVRPPDSRCDCGTDVHADLQQVVHDDGLDATCLRCRRQWVEFHTWPAVGSCIRAPAAGQRIGPK
jgi:hypothetical protein